MIAEGCSLAATTGSGVVVGVDGQVVTAAHTIRGATTITVVDSAAGEHAATVVAFDKDTDLAVLDVGTLDAPPLDLGIARIGTGATLTWTRVDGIAFDVVEVTRRLDITIEDIYGDGRVQRSGIEIQADIVVGDSGGPVLDETGAVIGVIYANSRVRDGIGFATDHDEIAEVIEARDDAGVGNGSCQ